MSKLLLNNSPITLSIPHALLHLSFLPHHSENVTRGGNKARSTYDVTTMVGGANSKTERFFGILRLLYWCQIPHVLSQKHHYCIKMLCICWKVMKICPLKNHEMKYWIFFYTYLTARRRRRR